MTKNDLIRHGCAPSVAAAAITALKKQAKGEALSDFEESMITMATPAITAYRNNG